MLSRIRVAAIVARVVAARAGVVNRLAWRRRIGVDEICYARDLITDHVNAKNFTSSLLTSAGRSR